MGTVPYSVDDLVVMDSVCDGRAGLVSVNYDATISVLRPGR